MGNFNLRFMDGWRSFERGESLHLGLKTDTAFADGWLAAAEAALTRTK